MVALQRRGYYLRKAGTDGYRFFSTPTLNKVVADRKATLDPDDVRKVMQRVVSDEFEKRKQLALEYFQGDGADIPDTTRLTAGLRVIDLGAGHASSSESLTGRIITALRTSSLLNESPGSAYLERRWPPAFKDPGAWPVASLRQAFLSGGMERLLDVDSYLKSKIPDFVRRGDFGFASGAQADGTYQRVWFNEELSPDEVTFDAGVFLLTKVRAKALTKATVAEASEPKATEPLVIVDAPASTGPGTTAGAASEVVTIRVAGEVPPESWTKLGIKLIPKLKSGKTMTLRLEASVDADGPQAETIRRELRQVFMDLGLADRFQIE